MASLKLEDLQKTMDRYLDASRRHYYSKRDTGNLVYLLQLALDEVCIIYDTYPSGPENSREEVVGTSTKGANKNSGNSGFSGGRPGYDFSRENILRMRERYG